MKKLVLSIAGLCSATMLSAQLPTLTWSTPEIVANGGTYGYTWPRLDLTNGDAPVVMWGNSSDNQLYVSRKGGASWSTPVNVLPSGIDAAFFNWQGPDIASSGDSVFVVFKQTPEMTGRIYTMRSLDGGATFADTVRVDNIGTDLGRFPAVDCGPGGNPMVTFMRFNSTFGSPRFESTTSTDGGVSYPAMVTTDGLAPGEPCDCCPTDIYGKGNIQLLPYRNNDSNIRDNWVSISTDNGVSYDTTLRMDNTNWFITSCPSQGPAATIVGDTGVVIWTTFGLGSWQTWLSTFSLTDYGIGTIQQIDASSSSPQRRPRIYAKGDTLSAIWEDSRDGSTDIYFSYSVSGPSGLFTNRMNILTTTNGIQEGPDVVYNNGVFHIVYSDGDGGNVMYLSAMMDGVSDIESLSSVDVELFPNPTSDQIVIRIPEEEILIGNQVQLLDAQGRVVKSLSMNSSIGSMDVSDLSSGSYMVRVELQDHRITEQVIIR